MLALSEVLLSFLPIHPNRQTYLVYVISDYTSFYSGKAALPNPSQPEPVLEETLTDDRRLATLALEKRFRPPRDLDKKIKLVPLTYLMSSRFNPDAASPAQP